MVNTRAQIYKLPAKIDNFSQAVHFQRNLLRRQVLYEDLHPDSDKDDAAEDFGLLADA